MKNLIVAFMKERVRRRYLSINQNVKWGVEGLNIKYRNNELRQRRFNNENENQIECSEDLIVS